MAVSNMPPGYSDEGDAPSHGRDTAIYQELLDVRAKYAKWLHENRKDMPNKEMEEKAEQIEEMLDDISRELNTPL